MQYRRPQGARASELAVRLRIGKQALTYTLSELETPRLLERRPDADDLYSKRVALTRRGTSAIDGIRKAVGEVDHAGTAARASALLAALRLLLELNQSA